MKSPDGTLTEPDITIDGVALTFPQAMTLRVALSSFRMSLNNEADKVALGEQLAGNYDNHAMAIENLMLLNLR